MAFENVLTRLVRIESVLLPDDLEHLDIDSSTEECGPIEERVWKDAHFWLALISAPIFSYFALTRFETFHLPSNRKSLIQQMRPTAVEANNVYRSLGNGLWSIKDLSMSPWHCGFSSFDSYFFSCSILWTQPRSSMWRLTHADPSFAMTGFGWIWPDYCCHCRQNDPHERPFQHPITPNWSELEWFGLMMLEGDPKFIQILMSWCFLPGSENFHKTFYIYIYISIKYHQEGGRWTVWQGFSISINFLNITSYYSQLLGCLAMRHGQLQPEFYPLVHRAILPDMDQRCPRRNLIEANLYFDVFRGMMWVENGCCWWQLAGWVECIFTDKEVVDVLVLRKSLKRLNFFGR